MSDKVEYTTMFLPEFLKQLDGMLAELPKNKPKLSTADYIQISLQLKTCQLLNEIKQELKELRKL